MRRATRRGQCNTRACVCVDGRGVSGGRGEERGKANSSAAAASPHARASQKEEKECGAHWDGREKEERERREALQVVLCAAAHTKKGQGARALCHRRPPRSARNGAWRSAARAPKFFRRDLSLAAWAVCCAGPRRPGHAAPGFGTGPSLAGFWECAFVCVCVEGGIGRACRVWLRWFRSALAVTLSLSLPSVVESSAPLNRGARNRGTDGRGRWGGGGTRNAQLWWGGSKQCGVD